MIYLSAFNSTNVLKHSKCISHYLAWMVIVGETIYDRYRCIFCQVQNILPKPYEKLGDSAWMQTKRNQTRVELPKINTRTNDNGKL
jgi:hypothetical protein